jgi:hypothetical protein
LVARLTNQTQARDARLKKLARAIETLAAKDDLVQRHAREMSALRRSAAADLHAICADFVSSLNRLLEHSEVELDPRTFAQEHFSEEGTHLIQINVRGRILQIAYRATPELVSTEDFRVPYTLEGTVRAFNQAMLDKDLIEEQLVFFTLENHKKMWRFFDARTYRSGPFDPEYLIALMEQLL